jgi:peptidoglycan/LPS O-acetylase OafA/YrhL
VAWWVICAFIGLAIPFFGQLSLTAVTAPAKVIARYSYAVYLSHYFCMWVALEKMHGLPLPLRVVTFLLLLAFVSLGLYRAIEHPFIKLGQRVANAQISCTAQTPQTRM